MEAIGQHDVVPLTSKRRTALKGEWVGTKASLLNLRHSADSVSPICLNCVSNLALEKITAFKSQGAFQPKLRPPPLNKGLL